MQDEHLQIQANRKDGTNLTWSEVNNMPYTNKVSLNAYIYIYQLIEDSLWTNTSSQQIQVISETLRRATILPWYSRKAAQDFEIDGILVYDCSM